MSFTSLHGNAKRLRVYIGDSDLWRGRPLYAALLDHLKREGLAGVTVLRGVAGFGAHSRIHTASIVDLSSDLPLVIEVIDTAEKIAHALEVVSPMVREGLITLEDVEVVAYTHRFTRPLPADRPVREVMTRHPLAARAGDSILDAWNQMLRNNIKALPVVDDQQRVVGVITHEDVMERAGLNARLAVAQRLDEESLAAEMNILRASPLNVEKVMSKPPITVHLDDSLGAAAGRLVKHSITRLPVVDDEGRLAGIVSRLDVLRQVMDIPQISSRETSRPTSGRLARDVMQAEIPQVRQETHLSGVIASFLASGEHRVIVVDAGERPIGLISDSDVVGRIQPAQRRGILGALRGRSGPPDLSITAAELMSPGVATVPEDASVIEAVQTMLAAGRKWLVVIDPQGRSVGLIDREIALEALV